MIHEFKLIHCYEWSDDYRCLHCGLEINVAAEDNLRAYSAKEIEKLYGPCKRVKNEQK